MHHHSAGWTRSARRPALRGGLPALALLTLPLLAGCDSTPTEPGADPAEAFRLALDAGWAHLPSTMELEVQALEGLEGTPASGEVAALLLDAGDLAAQAGSERTEGSARNAEILETAGESLLTRGLLASLGGVRAGEVLDEAQAGLDQVIAALGSTPGGEAAAGILAEAGRDLASARATLAAGEVGEALVSAARASESTRSLDRERTATATVKAAWALLERAVRLAGPSPEAAIARALGDADASCVAAREALGMGNWGEAMTRAHRCARLARAVLARLSAGVVDEGDLTKRVEGVVAHAAALLERATAKAGSSPRPAIRQLLSEAGDLLTRAQGALADGRYRQALRYAQGSAVRSLRVLAYLDTAEGDPLELRAKAAVEAAQALAARVATVLTEDAPPEIKAVADSAAVLVREANAALQVGDWRRALARAREASTLLMRILQALG